MRGLSMFWKKKEVKKIVKKKKKQIVKKQEIKEELSADFVELSIGVIYFKPISYGLINSAISNSTLYGSVINNNLFFTYIEYHATTLNEDEIKKLTPQDGEKLRLKLKNILKRYGVVKEEAKKDNDKVDLFSKNDVEWFNDVESRTKSKLIQGR